LHGIGGLDSQIDNYEEWVKNLDDYANGQNLPAGYVPASTYFAIREIDNRIVGMLNIRHELSEYLLEKGGHLGNCVRPTERNKGYGTEILFLALEKCRALGIDKALLVCNKNNVASAKQIQNNFGVLENEVRDNDKILQRYWVDVNHALTNRT
jgi:predicted acetyltransferase